MRLGERELHLLRTIGSLTALTYRQLADLCYGGDLRRAYEDVDRYIEAGLLRQKEVPHDRRQRAVLLTQAGARAADMRASSAQVKTRTYRKVLEENEFYVRAVRAGLDPKRVLPRQDALKLTRTDRHNCSVSWGISSPDGVHFVYVHHAYVTKRDILDSLTFADNKALSHNIVCKSEASLLRHVKWFSKILGVPSANLLTLDEVPVLVSVLRMPDFAELARFYMAALVRKGHLATTDLACDFSLAWEAPGKGKMLLADLRLGNLQTLMALDRHDHSGQPVTVFVMTEEQAKRWASYLRWPEPMWFLVCNTGTSGALYQVTSGTLVLQKVVMEGDPS